MLQKEEETAETSFFFLPGLGVGPDETAVQGVGCRPLPQTIVLQHNTYTYRNGRRELIAESWIRNMKERNRLEDLDVDNQPYAAQSLRS